MKETTIAKKPLDPLADAIELYRRYVEIAQLSLVGLSEPVNTEPAGYRPSWDHPLGLHFSSK